MKLKDFNAILDLESARIFIKHGKEKIYKKFSYRSQLSISHISKIINL